MPQSRRRRRRERNPLHSIESLASGQPAASAPPPGTGWKWRTFPVYFAFALGSFIGVYGGVLSEIARQDGNDTYQMAAFIGVALLMGLGLSRLSTRWLISKRWIRARPQRVTR